MEKRRWLVLCHSCMGHSYIALHYMDQDSFADTFEWKRDAGCGAITIWAMTLSVITMKAMTIWATTYRP